MKRASSADQEEYHIVYIRVIEMKNEFRIDCIEFSMKFIESKSAFPAGNDSIFLVYNDQLHRTFIPKILDQISADLFEKHNYA